MLTTKGDRPPELEKTVLFLANVLANHQYAFRGTTSLVLQGLEMNVVDIDILVDKETALSCTTLLKDFVVSPVIYSETEKFKSYFGKFKVNDILVEVMGEWQIKSGRAGWSAPLAAAEEECREITVADRRVRVTTVETELKTFALMGRWTAYQKIRRQLSEEAPSQQQKLF